MIYYVSEYKIFCLPASFKFNVIISGQFRLSETPDVPGSIHPTAVLPGICTYSKFSFKENEKFMFYFFNTHYSHVSSNAREVSSNIILKRLNRIVEEDDIPIFFAGDLNCKETSKAFKIFINNGFNDIWFESGNNYINDGTFHDWQGYKNGKHIDWILGKGYEKINKSEIIYYNILGLYPSDHFPVISEVTIKGQRSLGVYPGDKIDKSQYELQPAGFIVKQNYPNPFNKNTMIQYDLPFAEFVEIRIFNISGKEINKLLSAYQLPGTHTIVWDRQDAQGKNLTTGFYFYEVRTATYQNKKKMSFIE